MTPAEEFRDAAQILRQHAKEATSPGLWAPGTVTGPSFSRGDAHWIALLAPGIGEPLATAFDSAALDELGHDFLLLAVARHVRNRHQAIQDAKMVTRPAVSSVPNDQDAVAEGNC